MCARRKKATRLLGTLYFIAYEVALFRGTWHVIARTPAYTRHLREYRYIYLCHAPEFPGSFFLQVETGASFGVPLARRLRRGRGRPNQRDTIRSGRTTLGGVDVGVVVFLAGK